MGKQSQKEFVVVNCFHFSVSLGYNTTAFNKSASTFLLWIAFIFQYLWDTTQQERSSTHRTDRCELLSFFSIFGIQHNLPLITGESLSVVNCFHFSVSLGYNTTCLLQMWPGHQLWIAFIFQYLWDTTQLLTQSFPSLSRCELLSFFSIFGIQHNRWYCFNFCSHVVNCFHFSVSLGYNTTIKDKYYLDLWLWIAFIFQYLWDTTQHVDII